jgi:hypothetical protein
VDNPKVFQYNKPKYTLRDKGGIDTTAIYLIDSSFNHYTSFYTGALNKVGKKRNDEFCRFFSGGQVVFISCDSLPLDAIPSIELINNRKRGTQGYYYVDGDRIRIDMFQLLNGGQTGKYFGKIQKDGSIMFYEQRPETYYGSFRGLERDGQKSFWKKVKVDSLIHYKPDW